MPNTDTNPNVSQGAEFYSVAQAAEILHLTPRAIRHRIKAGTLSATKLGPGTASYVISADEVARLLRRDVA